MKRFLIFIFTCFSIFSYSQVFNPVEWGFESKIISNQSFELIFNADITNPSNYRALKNLNIWLKKNKIVGLTGIDTRNLTNFIRDKGAPKGTVVFLKNGIDFAIPSVIPPYKILNVICFDSSYEQL